MIMILFVHLAKNANSWIEVLSFEKNTNSGIKKDW